MDLAYSPTTPGMSAATMVDLAVEAEALGYREAWVAEVAGPESFALLGAIARATRSMDLGVAVVPATTRSPALLAMAAGTVSQLLAGRTLSLGIGSSSEFIVDTWHAAPFHPPVPRVRAVVEGTRALLAGERDLVGEYTKVRRFALTSPPDGPVRLFVGALGPRMLALAGEVGDGACLNLMPPRVVARQRAAVEAGAAAAGRGLPGDFRLMARLHIVPTDDLVGGRALIRGAFGPYFAQPVYNRFLAWMGYPEEAASIASAFAAGDRNGVAQAMHDSLIDDIAIVGPPGPIRDRLDEFAAAGLDVAALNVIASDAAGVSTALRTLAPTP